MSTSLRERALRCLARREHARGELARKLAPHAQSPEELEALLDDLCARRLLSDARYAETRLNARAARFGDARLAHELRTQGVADELIGVALATADDELMRARAVWQKKFGAASASDETGGEAGDKAGGKAADAASRARQQRFLLSRGFSGETIRRVLRGDFEDD